MKFSGYIRSFLKDFSMKSGVYTQTFFGVYPYMFSPQQLMFMIQCIKDVHDVEGSFLEAGCAFGATTVFLNKFMQNEGIVRDYIAIDTFSGFVKDQYEFEINHRNKRKRIQYSFSENKQTWYDYSVSRENIQNVHSFCIDITKFDFLPIGPIAFCLLDVDLYLPVKDVLPKIYDHMAPGGIIIVDDCKQNCDWDGSYLAYQEFCNQNDFREEIHYGKLGVIKKAK
jgi:SAM-dependent methyltransferase